jgi:hypothetical protein
MDVCKRRLLRTLGTVLRTTLVTAFNAGSIQRAANGVVTNTWQVFTRPPRIRTTLCSCRLWPSPPMYEETSKPLVRRTRHTLRSAELGFFGVVVYTRVHTPRRCGQFCSAGTSDFSTDTLTRLTYQLVDSCHLLAPLLSCDSIVLQESQNGERSLAKFKGTSLKRILHPVKTRPRPPPDHRQHFMSMMVIGAARALPRTQLPLEFSASVSAASTSLALTRNGCRHHGDACARCDKPDRYQPGSDDPRPRFLSGRAGNRACRLRSVRGWFPGRKPPR